MGRCIFDMTRGCRFAKRAYTSRRGQQWFEFAGQVFDHIEDYTTRQYGDMPHDQASGFTIRDVAQNMRRYLNRVESNARGPAEALRDCLKLAHYACMLYEKLANESEVHRDME
jgi:hypothetical protein